MIHTKDYSQQRAISAFRNFLKAAHQNDRTAHVDAVAIAPPHRLKTTRLTSVHIQQLLALPADQLTVAVAEYDYIQIAARKGKGEQWQVTYHAQERNLTFKGTLM